jgi:aryl-alcohol dehydrogenase-like predicted oxidoreductase
MTGTTICSLEEPSVKITRRDFNKAGLGALSLAALGGNAVAGSTELTRKAIPSTGEMVPIIGLGTNRYGRRDRTVLHAALKRFHELGGTFIDTAPMYGDSEAVLGDLIEDLGIRDELFIATKADKDPGGDATAAQMQRSQERLRTKTFDLMQVHNLLGTTEALAKMREWQQDGKIRYLGITTSREAQYEEFERVMRAEKLDFIQINYSLEQRQAAERILPLAADKGVAVIINRAFGGGRIFEKVGKQPLPDWALEFGCQSWAQFLLKYAIGHPAATLSIPGMTKAHHVDDNFGAAHGRLPDAKERQRQEAFFDSL